MCPAEIAQLACLAPEFAGRDAVILGGSTDTAFVKIARRREHADLRELPIWQFANTNGSLADGLGVPEEGAGVAYCATYTHDRGGCLFAAPAAILRIGPVVLARKCKTSAFMPL